MRTKQKYSQQRINSEVMEITLTGNKEFSQSSLTLNHKSESDNEIFDKQFSVQDMTDPLKYLPKNKYSQNEGSCVQDCNICCGNICIGMAYCFGLCCCKCSSCVYQLQTSKAGLVEQFGTFSRLLKPGLNMINPCTEEITVIDLKIILLPAGVSQLITKDNVKVTVRSSIAYRITNPIISEYTLGNKVNTALRQLTSSSFRSIVGEEILDEVLTNRIKIVGEVRQMILKSIPDGIWVQRVFMEDIVVPPEIVKDLSSAARQRRISQANIISSQADVQTAKLMKQSAELLDTKAAMQIRYLQMVQQLGKRKSKVMMPIGVNKKGFQ